MRMFTLLRAMAGIAFLALLLPCPGALASAPTPAWTYTYGSGNVSDLIWGITTDTSGNVIAVGSDGDSGGTWLLRKFDTSGNTLWVDNAGGAIGQAMSVNRDSLGNLIVGGFAGGSPNWYWLLRKYSPSGTLLWSTTYHDPLGASDEIGSVTTDASNNVYAGGMATLKTGELWGMIKKYDVDGNLLWTRTFHGTGNYQDGVNALTMDNAGNLIAAGYSDPTNTNTQVMLRKYDSSGNVLWSTAYSYDSGINTDDRGDAVTTDATGNIYLAGHWMPGPWPYYAWLVRKYDSSGNIIWTKTLGGTANTENRPQGIALLTDGTVAVGGFLNDGGTLGRDWMVMDYDSSGNVQWSLTFNGAASGSDDEIFGMGQDLCGNLYVGGSQGGAGGGTMWRLQKYGTVTCTATPTGCPAPTPSRVYSYNNAATNGADAAQGIAVSPSDGSYAVAGYESVTGQGHNLLVKKFAHDGTLLWTASYNSPAVSLNDEARRVALDPSGNVIVVGRTDRSDIGQSWNMLTLKYDASGSLMWKREWDGGGTDDQAMSVAVDPTDGSIAVVGKPHASTNPDWMIFKYSPNGTTLWTASYVGPSGLFDIPYDVKIATNGDVVVAGDEQSSTQSYNVVVRRYTSAGTFLWHYEYNDAGNGMDYDGCLALDAAGNAYVAADSQQGFADVDWLLIKLNPAGVQQWISTVRPTTSDDFVWNVALDGCGEPIVVGADAIGAGSRWAIRKFDTSGNLLWSRTVVSAGGGPAEANSVAIDPSGSLYVAGYETVAGQGTNWRVETFDPDACCSTPPVGPPISLGALQIQTLGAVTVGSTVSWMIVATNAGAQAINTLTIVDTVSPVLVSASSSQPAGLPVTVTNVAGGTRYVWSGGGLGLAPGASLTVTVTGTIGLVCLSTTVSNVATLTATNGSGTARACTGTTGFLASALPLSQSISTQVITTGAIGDPVKYLTVVTNTGAVTIDNVTIVDTVSPVVINQATDQPAGFAPAVANVATGTRYVWSYSPANFQPGMSLTFTVTGNVGLVCVPTAVSNTVFGSAQNACANTTGFSNPAGFAVAPYTSGVVVSKLQVPATPISGGPVTYEIVVQNTGNVTIANVTVTDTISPVITAPTTDQPGGIPAGTMLTVASGTRFVWTAPIGLPPQTIWTFTITGTVGTVCVNTVVTNTSYVTGQFDCLAVRQFTNETDFAVTAPTVTVAVAKTVVTTGAIGDPVTCLTVVTNTSSVTISSLVVTDTLPTMVINQGTDQPAGFATAVAAVAGGTRYVWSNAAANFLPGTSLTFTVAGTVGLVCAPTAVSDTAFAVGQNACAVGQAFSNNAGFTIAPYATGLTVTKLQTPASPAGGTPVTYQIVVTNSGSATLQGVTVTDTVSPVVTAQAWDQPAGIPAPAIANVASGTRYVWSAGATTLLPGAWWTFTVTGTVGNVPANRLVSNTAFVAGGTGCAVVSQNSNNTAFLAQPIPTTSSLLVASSISAASYPIGSTGQFVLTVTNTGVGDCTNVTPLLAVSGSGTVSILSSPSTLATLAAGASASFTWTFSCTGGGSVTFLAHAAGTDLGNGSGMTSGATTSGCLIIAPGQLVCSLAVTPSPAAPGNAGQIVCTIVNPGSSAVTSVTPTLTVTGGAGLVSWPSGPTPASASSIAAGGSQTFTWTFQSIAVGTAAFGVTAIGSTPVTGTAYGTASAAVAIAAPVVTPPDDGLKPGGVKIVGGIRGYINPKRGEQATILVKATGPGMITVRIYDRRGTLLRTLTTPADGNGTDVLHWDANDESGAAVPAGIYPIVIQAPGISYTDKLAVLR